MSDTHTQTAAVGIIGARGYVGRELMRLIAHHPCLRLAFAASRALVGRPLQEECADAPADLRFIDPSPQEAADLNADVLILALPNGAAGEYVAALDASPQPPRLLIDVSADYRFDNTWAYGLPEHFESQLRTASRISNPGCYATAMQLALRPVVDRLAAPPCCFGVSGYSGAGATPSDRNNPEILRDNLLPYSLCNHLHEREVSRHLGFPVRFSPAVAEFFRGIVMTVRMEFDTPADLDALCALYEHACADCPLIDFLGPQSVDLREVRNTNRARIGSVTIHPDDPRQVAVVCAIDNLLKGAASQAIQNINLALGLPAEEGLL